MRLFFHRLKILFFFVLLTFFPSVTPVFAQEQITDFQTEITAAQNGEMQIKEIITYDFGSGERHGIFRFIPLVSRVGDLYRVIDVSFESVTRDGAKEPYEVDTSSDRIEIKIGDPDRTIIGEHTYAIVYRVKNGIGSNYEDHDEIYWNVTGNDWNIPIASASVVLKTDFGVPVGKILCFTGVTGTTSSSCTVEDSKEGKKITVTQPLSPAEGLTIVASFPVNTFPKSSLQKNKPMDPDVRLFLWIVIPLLILLNFILAPFLVYWYFKNRNKKRFGKPVVNFDLPKDEKGERITPAEAGTIDTTKLDKNDITATIFDLAIRKYVLIKSVSEKGKVLGIGKKESFELKKQKDFATLTEFEQVLMEALFQGKDTVQLSDFSLSYDEFKKLEKANFQSLIGRGFYSKNPAVQMGTLLTFGIISLATLNFVLGPVLLFLSRMLNGRTTKGDEADWHIDGLKIFLKATNRYHEWQAKNILTLEKMIPYAMSLGYIDQFMKQLKVLKPDYQPTWYHGRGNFYSSYGLFSSSVGTSITTTAPSSSSGFSGGSSGGGGGGGGGGSW